MLLGPLAVFLASGLSSGGARAGDAEALRFARDLGVVIGGATACGLSAARASATGRKGLEFARTEGPGVPAARLEAVHAEAVRAAALDQVNGRNPPCADVIRAYKGLEDQLTVPDAYR